MMRADPRPMNDGAHVLIVDDHPILRHGLAQLVLRESDFASCDEAGDPDEALGVLASRPIDVAIIDLSLGDRSGLDLLRQIRERHPSVRCLVLSMHDERLHGERALRAGAHGYLMKQEATKRIIIALRTLREGRIYASEALSSRMLERLAQPLSSKPAASPSPLAELSDRELEVLRLIGRGMKTGEIARTLHRSVHTVETHRSNIKRKLGLKTAGELSQLAFDVARADG